MKVVWVVDCWPGKCSQFGLINWYDMYFGYISDVFWLLMMIVKGRYRKSRQMYSYFMINIYYIQIFKFKSGHSYRESKWNEKWTNFIGFRINTYEFVLNFDMFILGTLILKIILLLLFDVKLFLLNWISKILLSWFFLYRTLMI